MKLKELRFKCLTGSPERNEIIQQKLFDIGFKFASFHQRIRSVGFLSVGNIDNCVEKCTIISYGLAEPELYITDEMPELTFEDALKLIDQVVPEKKFDIKSFDQVLTRHDINSYWFPEIYSHYGCDRFYTCGSNDIGSQLIKFDERYKLSKDCPDGWWELEYDLPVWKTK